MNRAALLAAILLSSCQSAPTKARSIMKPITKEVSKAKDLADRQRTSAVKLRGSVSKAADTAAKMNTAAPTEETRTLTLELDSAMKETNVLIGTNDELRLTLASLEAEVAKAQDKVAEKIAGAETWKRWAWRWFFAFSGIVVAVAAIVYFRQSIPFLKLL